MAKIITQHRRGTTAEWEATGVIPVNGEIIIVQDNGVRKLKIGDGQTKFVDLPYVTKQLDDTVASLNAQLQQAIAGTEEPFEGSWEKELQNIRIDSNGYAHKTAGEAVRQTQRDLAALETSLLEFINAKNVDGLEYTENYELYLTAKGVRVSEPVTIVGGSGGGGSNETGSTVTFENLTTNDKGVTTNTLVSASGKDVFIKYKFTSVDESNMSTGPYTCTLVVNGVQRTQLKNLPNGEEQTINVKDYLIFGSNTVQLILEDMYGSKRQPKYSVEVKDLAITSTYNSFTIQNTDFNFYFTVKGNLNKKVVFYIDNEEYEELEKYYSSAVITTEDSVTIPVSKLSSGVHDLTVQAFCTDDASIESSPQYFKIMIDKDAKQVMLSSTCSMTSTSQGTPVNISYFLYNPVSISDKCTVVLDIYTNSQKTDLYSRSFVEIPRNSTKVWTVKSYPYGESVCFCIAFYNEYSRDAETNELTPVGQPLVESTHLINVTENVVDVLPASDPVVYLSSKNKSNDHSDKDSWAFGNISTTFQNFNWVSNGWIPDTNNDTALRINGGARAIINYQPFYGLDEATGGLIDHGITIEAEFAIRDLVDRSCTAFSACTETTTTSVEESTYKYTYSNGEYNFIDSEDAVFIEHTDTHWVYREGVSGVLKPFTTYLPEQDTTGLSGSFMVDSTTTLTFSGSTVGTLKVTQTADITRVIGLKATPDTILLGTSQRTISCRYKDNERVRVTFTIDKNTDDSSRFISCYIDGTLSGTTYYVPGTDTFSNNASITLGSDSCTLDFYSFRFYKKALSAKDVLKNFIYDNSNVVTQREVYLDNLIYKDDEITLDYDAIKAKIPTITFYGDMPKYKGDKKIVKMDFVNPFDPDKNFSKVYGGPIDVEIDVQGTSSQYYVRKNWKVKLKSKDKATGKTIFNHAPYKHMNDEIPAQVFCIKVDYAEGTGTHNTQNANFAETLYVGKVPAQYDDSCVRTTVAGFPCVIFEKESLETGEIKFSSKGNFNFDKDAEEAFGFTDDYDVECWEFCNNVHNTEKFLERMNYTDWGDNFEARCFYPKYIDYESLGYESLSDLHDNIMDDIEKLQELADAENSTITAQELQRLQDLRRATISRFKRMHDWVVSTDGGDAGVNKFKAEFTKHFNLEYALVYYIYTFVALMTDQRAKNMFLTYWGRRVYTDATKGTWYVDDMDTGIDGSEPAPVPYLDEEDGIEYFNIKGTPVIAGFWYPYLYDNDTCYGIDNSGNMVFDYYHEDIDTWDNGQKYVYNGQESVLWNNFRLAFANEIKSKYAELRSDGKLTQDKIYEQFATNGSEMWSASIYNEDAEYKYLTMARPQGNGINSETGEYNPPDYANLYQVKGDGKHHLKYFLQNRFKYCDSKWHAGSYPTDIVYLRINSASDDYDSSITVTPFSSMYCGVQYGAGSSVSKQRAYANEQKTFAFSGFTIFLYDDEGIETGDSITLDEYENVVSISYKDTTYILQSTEDLNVYHGYLVSDSTKQTAIVITFDSEKTTAVIETTSTHATETFSCQKFESRPNDLETSIFGASELSSVGDLSKLYCSRIEFRNTNKLTSLKIGDSARTNSVLSSEGFSLQNCPLLEDLDITNCSGLTDVLDCSSSNNIQTISALGSRIAGVTLPVGGYVKKLHLPTTVTQLILNGQHNLKLASAEDTNGLAIGSEFSIADSLNLSIQRLCIYDCPDLDAVQVFQKCLQSGKLERVCLNNVVLQVENWKDLRKYYTPKESDVDNNSTEKPYYIAVGSDGVETFWKRGYQGASDEDTGIPVADGYGYGLKGITESNINMDQINIRGTCVIDSNMDGKDMAELVEHFPNLVFSVSEGHLITSTVYFADDDGTILLTRTASGTNAQVSISDLTAEELALFTKESSLKYDYVFTTDNHAWSMDRDSSLDSDFVPNRKPNTLALQNILGDRVLYPVFDCAIRSYPVYFYNDDRTTLLATVTTNFDANAVYSLETPVSTIYGVDELHPFAGWDLAVTTETGEVERLLEVVVNETSLNYNSRENTYNTSVNVYAVFKTLDEQYEVPSELELLLDGGSSGVHILGRSESWKDIEDPTNTNVFVKINDTYGVNNQTGPVVSVTGFHDFENMKLISLPDTVTTLNCKELTNPARQVGAFENCTNLVEFTVGPNVKTFGNRLFRGCTNLKTIYYNAVNADSATTTVDGKVDRTKPFESSSTNFGLNVHIGGDVQNIPDSLFYKSSKVNNIYWSEDLEGIEIKQWAFRETSIVNSVVDNSGNDGVFEFPEGTIIRDNAFEESLDISGTILQLPNNGAIHQNAFYKCNGIVQLNIPENVTIGRSSDIANPFRECLNLTKILIDEKNEDFELIDDRFLIYKPDKRLICAINLSDGKEPLDFNRQGMFTAINSAACEKLTNIRSVVGAEDLREIGNSAFNDSSVTDVDLSKCTNLTTISSSAFNLCGDLISIQLPPNLQRLDARALRKTAIESIVIPASVIEIGYDVFKDCENLKSVVFEDPENWKLYTSSGEEFGAMQDLTDPTANATYVKSPAYCPYTWKKTN